MRDRGDAGQDTPETAEPRVAHARSENTEPVTSDSIDASGSMDATEDVSLESGHAEPKAQQSCLQWFAVDLYVNGNGQVLSVQAQVWER